MNIKEKPSLPVQIYIYISHTLAARSIDHSSLVLNLNFNESTYFLLSDGVFKPRPSLRLGLL